MSPGCQPSMCAHIWHQFAKDSLHFIHVHKTVWGTGRARTPPSLPGGNRGPETPSDLLMVAQQFVVVLLRAPHSWSCTAPRPA